MTDEDREGLSSGKQSKHGRDKMHGLLPCTHEGLTSEELDALMRRATTNPNVRDKDDRL